MPCLFNAPLFDIGESTAKTEQITFLETENLIHVEPSITDDNWEAELDPGTHRFNFSFSLPLNIPSKHSVYSVHSYSTYVPGVLISYSLAW